MISLLFDENFNGRIVRGLNRAAPDLDVIRIQDAGLIGWEDPDLLEWAAENGRVMVSHDVNTMTAFANERLAEGKPMAGLVLVSNKLAIGQVIEELHILTECSTKEEFESLVMHLPLT